MDRDHIRHEFNGFSFTFINVNRNLWIHISCPMSHLRVGTRHFIRQVDTFRVNEAVLNDERIWKLGYPSLPEELRLYIRRFIRLSAFL